MARPKLETTHVASQRVLPTRPAIPPGNARKAISDQMKVNPNRRWRTIANFVVNVLQQDLRRPRFVLAIAVEEDHAHDVGRRYLAARRPSDAGLIRHRHAEPVFCFRSFVAAAEGVDGHKEIAKQPVINRDVSLGRRCRQTTKFVSVQTAHTDAGNRIRHTRLAVDRRYADLAGGNRQHRYRLPKQKIDGADQPAKLCRQHLHELPGRKTERCPLGQQPFVARRQIGGAWAPVRRGSVTSKEVVGNLHEGLAIAGRVMRMQHQRAILRICRGPGAKARLLREIDWLHRGQVIVREVARPLERWRLIGFKPRKTAPGFLLDRGPQQGMPREHSIEGSYGSRSIQPSGEPRSARLCSSGNPGRSS